MVSNIASSTTSSKNQLMTLCDAALEGNVDLLHQLLERDPFILHRPPPMAVAAISNFSSTTFLPLHTACRLGHLEFASELLRLRPDLLVMIDPYDQSSSPLHIACRNGHLELVKCLLSVDPHACFLRNNQGWNPVHVAAAKGHCDVLDELIRVCPPAAVERIVGPGQYRSDGDTIMHICAKYNQLEALKKLVKIIGNNRSILDACDGNGNTIFDIAVAYKQTEVIEFLLSNKRTKNLSRKCDLTPMEIHSRLIHEHDTSNNAVSKLRLIFDRLFHLRYREAKNEKEHAQFEDRKNALLVVASLIVTVALQSGINPPGGVWSDDSMSSPTPSPSLPTNNFFSKQHRAGTSIMAQQSYVSYMLFISFNTMGLLYAVVSIILLTTNRLPGKFASALSINVTLAMALLTLTVAYLVQISSLTPTREGFPTFLQFLGFVMLSTFIGPALMMVMPVRLLVIFMYKRSKRRLVQLCRNIGRTN